MSKLILLINLLVWLLWLPCFAIDLKYTIHTSTKDIDFKKQKALNWYTDNLDNNKFYFYDFNKQIELFKKRSLRWYENNLVNNKSYLLDMSKEIEYKKNKALSWFDKNSN